MHALTTPTSLTEGVDMTQNETSGSNEPRSRVRRYVEGNLKFIAFATILVGLMSLLKHPTLATAIWSWAAMLAIAGGAQALWRYLWHVKQLNLIAEVEWPVLIEWAAEKNHLAAQWIYRYRIVLIVVGIAFWAIGMMIVTISTPLSKLGGVVIGIGGAALLWGIGLFVHWYVTRPQKPEAEANEDDGPPTEELPAITDERLETNQPTGVTDSEPKADRVTEAQNEPAEIDTQVIATRAAEAIQDGDLAVQHQILGELQGLRKDMAKQNEPLPEDNNVYWDKMPHVWYFIVRFWRIIVAAILALALVSAVVYAYVRWMKWAVVPAIICVAVIACVIAGLVWYIRRRTRKWTHLKIKVVGYDAIISEPIKKSLLLLTGEDLVVPIIDCNNFVTSKTRFQRFFNLKCGNLYIDTPIEDQTSEGRGDDGRTKKIHDKFRNLTWVRDHEELAILLRKRRADILFRQGRTTTVPLKSVIS